MTKTEKNAIADVIGILNAVLTGNSDGDQPANGDVKNIPQADNLPSQEEIDFVKKLANDGEIEIEGAVKNFTKKTIGVIGISSNCLSRLLEAYLEKYDHE